MKNENIQSNSVLSIYPHTKGCAFAYFESPRDLIDWGNISFKPDQLEEKLQILIDQFKPETVITEDCSGSGYIRGKKIKKTLCDIYKFTDKKGVFLKKYSRSMIKGVFDCFDTHNKDEIAVLLTSWFPGLSSKLPPKRKIWLPQNYRMRVFDAVAFACAYFYTEG